MEGSLLTDVGQSLHLAQEREENRSALCWICAQTILSQFKLHRLSESSYQQNKRFAGDLLLCF